MKTRPWLLAALCSVSTWTVAALRLDGDPLEEYDFTGSLPLEEFTSHSKSQVWQHGLWTVQRIAHYDAFEHQHWKLLHGGTQRVGIYYGSWPKWSSTPHSQAFVNSVGPAEPERAQPAFQLVQDDLILGSPASLISLTDQIGSNGINLIVSSTNRGTAGPSAQIVRLSGADAESARVEELWSGGNQTIVDYDGDGRVEILDTDLSLEYAESLPFKGLRQHILLTWDVESDRFVPASEDLYFKAMAPENAPPQTREEWIQETWDKAEEAAEKWDPSGSVLGRDAIAAQATLASSLAELIWRGEAEEARRLFDGLRLPSYYGDAESSATSDDWWGRFRSDCQSGRYWPLLLETYPQLGRL